MRHRDVVGVLSSRTLCDVRIRALQEPTVPTEDLSRFVPRQLAECRGCIHDRAIKLPHVLFEIQFVSSPIADIRVCDNELTETTKLQLQSTGPKTVLGLLLPATFASTLTISNPVVEYNPGMLGPAGVVVANVPGLTRPPNPFEAIREAAAGAVFPDEEEANAFSSDDWNCPFPDSCPTGVLSCPKVIRDEEAKADESG